MGFRLERGVSSMMGGWLWVSGSRGRASSILYDGQLVVGFRLERSGVQQFGFQAREVGVQHFGKHFTFIRLYCAVRGGDENIDY